MLLLKYLIYRFYVKISEDSCILGYDAAMSGKYFLTLLGLLCIQSIGDYTTNNIASYSRKLDSSERLL